MNDNQIEVLSKALEAILSLRAVIATGQLLPDKALARQCRIQCAKAVQLATALEDWKEWNP